MAFLLALQDMMEVLSNKSANERPPEPVITDFTEIFPPIFSVKFLVMYNPNPLPWTFLVKGLSILENLVKIFS